MLLVFHEYLNNAAHPQLNPFRSVLGKLCSLTSFSYRKLFECNCWKSLRKKPCFHQILYSDYFEKTQFKVLFQVLSFLWFFFLLIIVDSTRLSQMSFCHLVRTQKIWVGMKVILPILSLYFILMWIRLEINTEERKKKKKTVLHCNSPLTSLMGRVIMTDDLWLCIAASTKLCSGKPILIVNC